MLDVRRVAREYRFNLLRSLSLLQLDQYPKFMVTFDSFNLLRSLSLLQQTFDLRSRPPEEGFNLLRSLSLLQLCAS
jgi:hypothetical protein